MAERQELTVRDGTPLGEAVSSMIKELRRGKELEALYWAKQIEERYWKYVWKRLLIFAAEDVSIANPNAIVQVEACRQAYLATRESKAGGDALFCEHCGAELWADPIEGHKADKDVLAMAVLVLCRSGKTRESNLLWALLSELQKKGWKTEVPEYALDGHTKRGRQLHKDRDERHRRWFLDWSRVIPNVGPNDVHAWHVRRMVKQGRLDQAIADQIIEEYRAKDQLVYGDSPPWPEWDEV